ncbi:hypothetical protein PTKIN_Ptkin11bG0090900 [Pterospermum kingtungense]
MELSLNDVVSLHAFNTEEFNQACCLLWHRPPANYYNCNVDMATFEHERKIGFGMVIRDTKGTVVACKTQVVVGLCSSKEGEAIGVAKALSWIYNMGLRYVIVETTAKAVIDVIQSTSVDMSEFGCVVAQCKEL